MLDNGNTEIDCALGGRHRAHIVLMAHNYQTPRLATEGWVESVSGAMIAQCGLDTASRITDKHTEAISGNRYL